MKKGKKKIFEDSFCLIFIFIFPILLTHSCSYSRNELKVQESSGQEKTNDGVWISGNFIGSMEIHYEKKKGLLHIILEFPFETNLISSSMYNAFKRKTDQIRFQIKDGELRKSITFQSFMEMNQYKDNYFIISIKILEAGDRADLISGFRIEGEKRLRTVNFSLEKIGGVLNICVNGEYQGYIGPL